jgi:hypothetical protein
VELILGAIGLDAPGEFVKGESLGLWLDVGSAVDGEAVQLVTKDDEGAREADYGEDRTENEGEPEVNLKEPVPPAARPRMTQKPCHLLIQMYQREMGSPG